MSPAYTLLSLFLLCLDLYVRDWLYNNCNIECNLIQLETKESLCDMPTIFKVFQESRADKREQTLLYYTQNWSIIPLLCSLQWLSSLSCFCPPFISVNSCSTFVSRHKPGCALGSACMGCLMSTEAVGRRAAIAAISAASEPCSGMGRRAAG